MAINATPVEIVTVALVDLDEPASNPNSMSPGAFALLVEGIIGGSGEEPPAAPKPFALELRFDTREELARVKRSLKKAAGKGQKLEAGLMRIIDGA